MIKWSREGWPWSKLNVLTGRNTRELTSLPHEDAERRQPSVRQEPPKLRNTLLLWSHSPISGACDRKPCHLSMATYNLCKLCTTCPICYQADKVERAESDFKLILCHSKGTLITEPAEQDFTLQFTVPCPPDHTSETPTKCLTDEWINTPLTAHRGKSSFKAKITHWGPQTK